MINNKLNTALNGAISTAADVHSRCIGEDKANNVATVSNGNSNSRGGMLQTTYGHGIWYSEIIESTNNGNYNAIAHKQLYYNNPNSNNDNNNKANTVNRNMCLLTDSTDDSLKEQKQQQSQCSHANNDCDIIIVDMENDDSNEVERQPTYNEPAKFLIDTSKNFAPKHPRICDRAHNVVKNYITSSANNNTQCIANDINAIDNDHEVEDEDEDDSLASMETLSDNVSIWIDGEKHWVAGVDANTTCSQLIWALLNYQTAQQSSQRQSQHQQQRQHAFAVATTMPMENEKNIVATVINHTNNHQYEQHKLQMQQEQLPKVYDKNNLDFNLRMENAGLSSNICNENKPNTQHTASTNKSTTSASNPTTTTTLTNQSMSINTKENCKIIQNSTSDAATATVTGSSSSTATPIISSSASTSATVSELTPPATLLPLTLPPGIATASQLATEYVIVKQYDHCEEYLDGSTKVFDVLPPRNGSNKKECELLLRHLGPAPAVYINNATPQLSSLISTDKDSGMGSPVGSARSAKFRRRKHKSSQWLAQANTLHPNLSRCTANERLMKIILAQDETIQHQLSLLREKERQITKIEEEKHRKRERELGKNYLLETYLNGLDEADCEPEIQNGEEIFIDLPPHHLHCAAVSITAASATNPKTTITPSAQTLPPGAVKDKLTSAAEVLSMMPKHKVKEKEAKKEKKKKRHKEKPKKDDDLQAKDFNQKTNKNKDQVRMDIQQQHYHEYIAADEHNVKDKCNEEEIKLQVFWLEKIYTLNKQLQREEELAAKLHGKVRKHQLRQAQQTQREAQMEIDKLDNNLALQCGDIRKVEANLMQTNEQLQKKLLILERLSIDYLHEQEQQEKEPHKEQDDKTSIAEKQVVTKHTIKDMEKPLTNDASNLLTALEKSVDMKRLSLNNIKSKEEAIKFEKLIAKPSIDLRPAKVELQEVKQVVNTVTESVTSHPSTANTKITAFQSNHRFSNATSILTNQQQFQRRHQPELSTIPATALPVARLTSQSDAANSNDVESTSCMFIDKNMLSSLHVQNAKTIKKQMFHTQSTATASTPTTSAQLLPPTQLPSVTSGFPKQQFQHTVQQHMPVTHTFLTSRPQNSHQIQATNILTIQQPPASNPYCFSHSHLTVTTSSPLSSASATSSAIIVQHPPASTSPSPSIMAMNTVDISQLGTLV